MTNLWQDSFAAAIAFWLLTRTEKKLAELTAAVERLREALERRREEKK